jgi:hypothetical protein
MGGFLDFFGTIALGFLGWFLEALPWDLGIGEVESK